MSINKVEHIDDATIKQIADKCDTFASILRDNKQQLPTWQWIVRQTANEIVGLMESTNLIESVEQDDQV